MPSAYALNCAADPTSLECVNKRNISFTPTVGDVSIVFLGNIFGSVNGVLAGSGSQIIGELFGVFNAGLLSFGGIVILYTLMISTMNTAGEGQLMGQRWSSVWIPIRTTFGLGLLMPQASGYCLMQVFVMWIVVQGIGAADSIWSGTLSYLNRGGVLIQKKMSSDASADAGDGAIMTAAMGIAAAQVCMKTLNIEYEKYRKIILTTDVRCNLDVNTDANDPWFRFCHNPVPDFVGSVNITSEKNLQIPPGNPVIQVMPDFGEREKYAIYPTLNGICGQLTWKAYSPNGDSDLTNSEYLSTKNSRTIAVHQLYTALLTISMPMVSNAPTFNDTIGCGDQVYCVDTKYAQYQYGYPLTRSYTAGCKNRLTPELNYDDLLACTDWGTIYQQSTLLGGKELQDAVAAYNGIMVPTLSLDTLNSGNSAKEYDRRRAFIKRARSDGWLMAGAYFFQVAQLNNYVANKQGGSKMPTDGDSGLLFEAGQITGQQGGPWKYSYVNKTLDKTLNGACKESKRDSNLAVDTTIAQPFCELTSNELNSIGGLIMGDGNFEKDLPTYTSMYDDRDSGSYVYTEYNTVTYLRNSNSILLPDQHVVLDAGLKDSDTFDFNTQSSVTKLSKQSFSGGKWGIAGSLTSLVWNGILRPLWNMFLELMIPPIMELFYQMISPMLDMSARIFNNALDVMRIDGVNPIIAISVMGNQFISGVGDSWLAMAFFVAPAAVFPPAYSVLMMLMPIVTGWMGIMLTIGFSSAFYVPFVPVLVFIFAGMAWLIAVIEAMTAAPIVALGTIHPEGNEAFGKGEQAIMILLNMFLRPSLMVLGYIFGIILSYVGVWMMNVGFNMTIRDVDYLQPLSEGAGIAEAKHKSIYGLWTSIFLFYFTILAYTALYVTIVQQAFEMIHYLPDKILRWLSGGYIENLGESTTRSMLADVKSKVDEAGAQASSAMSKVSSSLQTMIVPEQK